MGITETKVLFNLDFLNFTFPLIKEKIEWSLPMPTLSPGWILVPLCLTIIFPGITIWSPYYLTPRRLPLLSRPFFDDPPAFFVAI